MTFFPGSAFTAAGVLFFASRRQVFHPKPKKTGKKREKTEKGLDNWGKQM